MRRRWQLRYAQPSAVIVTLFVLIFAVFGAYKLWFSNAASATANLWIDPNGGTCSRSATPSAYNDSAACADFSSAYQAAQPGDLIYVTCGANSSCTLPNQNIYYPLSKANVSGHCREAATFQDGTSVSQDYSACVTIQAAPGSTVTIGNSSSNSIDIEVPYVRLDGFKMPLPVDKTTSSNLNIGANVGRVNAPCSAWNVHDVIVTNLTSSTFTVHSSSYVYLEKSSFGPLFVGVVNNSYTSGASQVSSCNNQGVTGQDHLVLDGITLHDYHMLPDIGPSGGVHMEGIHWNQGDYGIVKNSRFENIGQQDLSFQNSSGTAGINSINHLLLENNYFDKACSNPAPGDSCGVVSGGTTTFICYVSGSTQLNNTIRYNSYDARGWPSFQTRPIDGCAGASFSVLGNIIAGPVSAYACTQEQAAGVTYAYNVFFNNVACGTGNSLANSGSNIYMSPSYPNYDYSLKVGSAAVDFIPSGQQCPSTDIIGTSRPQGTACDAGAFELSGANSSTSTSSTSSSSTSSGGSTSTSSTSTSSTSTSSGGGTTIPGDCNNDSKVNVVDLSTLLSNYNTNYTACDFNKDSIVNILDLSTLLSHWTG